MQSNKSNGQLTAQINMSDIKKSGFDLSNNVLGTGKIGQIIPTRALHVMPGDTIKAESKVAVQFEPLAVPILANMDVKQEHFYVTYNSVWKNWDKFISGGEKLDYNGVVPNVNMQRIASVVYDKLNLPIKFTFSADVDTTKYPQGVFYFSNKSDFNVSVYADSSHSADVVLDTLGNTYGIKDILNERVRPACKKINQVDLPDKVEGEEVSPQDYALFEIRYVDTPYTSIQWQSMLRYIWFNETKEWEILKEAILDLAVQHNAICIPTEYGYNVLRAHYEMYKPFIGIGSNIDYLNMNRVTFTDFLYSSIYHATTIVYSYTSNNGPIISIDQPLDFSMYMSELPMSILNLRANYLIWYNNYRDVLLETTPIEPILDDAITDEELFTILVPRQRCWEKDAFTTALDNPGTGNVGVPITDVSQGGVDSSLFISYYNSHIDPNSNYPHVSHDGNNIVEVKLGDSSWKLPNSYLYGITNLEGQQYNNKFSGFSLYALDAAQRAQKWLQKALFYGNRISDFYYMHFGVRFLDARLRLPELLTSSSQLVKIDTIMNNTTIASEGTIAGDRAGFASAYDDGNNFDRFCEEHGVIMSYMTIMPQVTYAYGMNRDYSRLDQFDFAFNEFATLGMDAVYDSEITNTCVKLPNTFENSVNVFGYQGKYYDFKAKHSEEHGELLESQDMYTFARKFNMYFKEGRPRLNYEFVHCFPDTDMFVVDDNLSDLFRYDIRHSTAAERNLPSQSLYI